MIAKLQETSCPICQADFAMEVARPKSHHSQISDRFSVVKCQVCDLQYLNPRPDFESLNHFYQLLQAQEETPSDYSPKLKSGNWLKRFWYHLNYSNPLLPLVKQSPILDVGCGRGELIAELIEDGYEAHGLEFDSSAVVGCQNRGFQVTQGSIETFDPPKGFYKCVVLSHALEHFLDPVSVLKKIKDALPKDGKVIIAVPYVKSPMVSLFGNNWHGWDPPFHLTHFDQQTLPKICDKAGLKVIQMKVGGHPEDFTRSFALKTGKPGHYLFLRAILWIPVSIAQLAGRGSYLLAIAEPDS